MARHADADVMISFASLRSAEESTIEALGYHQIRTIAIIAEGLFGKILVFEIVILKFYTVYRYRIFLSFIGQ